MRPILYNSMFEFIINDGQDSTTLNWRSLFRKIAYRASKKIVAKKLKIFTKTVLTFGGPKKRVSDRKDIIRK